MKRFIKKVKTLLYWFPIIWKDEDWDYIFLLKILRYKLVSMKTFFNSNECHTYKAEERAKEMGLCIKLLDRIIKDEYNEIAHFFHNKKWGNIVASVDENKSLSLIRPNIKSEKDREQEKKEFLKCIDQERYLERQDIRYLFKIINKKVESWWD